MIVCVLHTIKLNLALKAVLVLDDAMIEKSGFVDARKRTKTTNPHFVRMFVLQMCQYLVLALEQGLAKSTIQMDLNQMGV